MQIYLIIFYIWLRRSIREVYPRLFSTLSVPKNEELVASAYRHGTKRKAELFFLDGMTQVMRNISLFAHPAPPITIYYAFKQTETEGEGTNSTGWETFLDAVLEIRLGDHRHMADANRATNWCKGQQ